MLEHLRCLSDRLFACFIVVFICTGFGIASSRASAPAVVVLYKDESGTFTTRTDSQGDILLDIHARNLTPLANLNIDSTRLNKKTRKYDFNALTHFQLPISLDSSNPDTGLVGHWSKTANTIPRPGRESMARILIPFATAALAFGSISKNDLDYTSTDFQTNFGQYMVLATVNNLAQYVDEAMAELLTEHHLGGSISPEWAAKGAVAVLMLGMGQFESIGDKSKMDVGQSIRLFAQSRFINTSSLLLGDASGQVLDRIVALSPKTRKLVTSAVGGTSTGGLYYLLTEALGGRDVTKDLQSKICHATIFGIAKATTPFIEDFVGLTTDQPLQKHLGTHAVLEVISLSLAGGLYGFVSQYPSKINPVSIYFAKLLAGGFSKLAGVSLAELLGIRSFNAFFSSQNKSLPFIRPFYYLFFSMITNEIYKGADPQNTLFKEALSKMRDGIYFSMLTNGMTSLIDDFMQMIRPPVQPITLNLTLDHALKEESPASSADADISHRHNKQHGEL